MIKVQRKFWKNMDDDEKIAYCKGNLIDPAMDERKNNDWDWYINQMFMDGNHYIYYNTATNTIENVPRVGNTIRLTINKTKSTVRAIQNYTTRFSPKWEVVPGDIDEETITRARRSGKMLDYMYRKLYVRSLIRKLIRSGLTTSVGWWEVGWDDTLSDGKGDVYIENHDPFDIFLPKSAYLEGSSVVRSPFIAKVIDRHVQDVKNDERYDEKARKKVEPDNELAKSDYKARILRKHGYKDSGRKEGAETVLVNEVFLHDPEGNDAGGNINIFTFAGDKILREEETDMTEFPLYLFRPDNSDNRIYGQPMVSDIIPLNKALNRVESALLQYVIQTSKFRLIADKGHGANLYAVGRAGADAEVLEINKGAKFEQITPIGLPLTIHRLIDDVNRYTEDVSGAHESSMGVAPAGTRSGKQLEALQAGDSNNLSGIRESLEDFLSVIGSRILDIIADKYVASRVIKLTEPEEGQDYMQVVGENADINLKEGGLVVNKDNEVIVKIGSWLGYTLEAQRETLMEMAQMGILPKDEVLRQFEFANIQELSAKAKSERLEEHQLKAEIAGRRGETGMGGQTPPNIDLADQENARMMSGEQIPPTPGATPEHTQAHVDFMSSPDAQSSQQAMALIQAHASGEAQQQGQIR
jgi:hypothetical protein